VRDFARLNGFQEAYQPVSLLVPIFDRHRGSTRRVWPAGIARAGLLPR
jgi:hypothetical protein